MGSNLPFRSPEVQIRTISVSILAVVAVTAGVLVSRARHAPDETPDVPSQDVTPLEALRQAGI